VGDGILYMDPSKFGGNFAPKWTDRGKVVEVKFKSAKVLLDNGKHILANMRRIYFVRRGIVGMVLRSSL
jgi:hypothetical protein